jgi:flagellar biosynthesis protein FlhF
MQIKRFEARNMTEALRQIKRELGTEAVILSAKDIRKENRLLGISRKVGVEVTAAVDGGLPRQGIPAPARKISRRLSPDGLYSRAAGPAMSANPGDDVQDVVRLGRLSPPPQSTGSGLGTGDSSSAAKRPGGSRSMSGEDSIASGSAAASDLDALAADRLDWQRPMHRHFVDGGLEIMPWPFKNDGPHHIALVGSAGVGKTTTIAKLAARLQHVEGRRVGLISLDREKIGAIEQLQIYADILKIPLAVPQSGKDLKRAIKQLRRCDVVLVDTPAIDGRGGKRFPVFEGQLNQVPQLQVWLVIGADTQFDSMQLSAAMGDDLAPSAIVITKTDMSPNLGAVMRFLSTASRPVVCLTNGPEVPRDLTEASLDLFARLLMQTGSSEEEPLRAEVSANGTAGAGQYLANRSSDIVHRAGCKWIRLINRDNIVVFGSFAEALNNGFKPCRYCNPQHLSITGNLNREKALHLDSDHRKRLMTSRSPH